MKLIYFTLLTVGAVTDLQKKEIDIRIPAALAVLGLVVHLIQKTPLLFLSGLLPGIGLAGIAFCTKESVGYGDVCWVLAGGAVTGGIAVTGQLFLALVLCGGVSLAGLFTGKIKRGDRIPFLPFFLAALCVRIIADWGMA